MAATMGRLWQMLPLPIWTMPALQHRYGLTLSLPTMEADESLQAGHWTLDYASSNTAFMQEFAILLQQCDFNFNPVEHRIMCFLHIVNTCCHHLIDNLTDVGLTKSAEVSVGLLPLGPPEQQTFKDTVKWDPVALSHNIVHLLQSSGQRRDLFDDIIDDGNAKGWFLDDDNPPQVCQLPLVQLLHDMIVRWDTVYYMVRCL